MKSTEKIIQVDGKGGGGGGFQVTVRCQEIFLGGRGVEIPDFGIFGG